MEAPPGEKFRGVPVVKLEVGPDQVPCHVHENILCDASKVFKAAFCGQFKESADRAMSLPDDEVDTVDRLIQWLYSSKLPLTRSTSIESSNECYWQLAELNTLADKYDIVCLKNSIIDELYELRTLPKLVQPPQIPVINYVYANTNEDSSFRKLLVAWYAWHINFDWYDTKGPRACLAEMPEFSADLTVALATRINHPNEGSAFAPDKSDYYETPT